MGRVKILITPVVKQLIRIITTRNNKIVVPGGVTKKNFPHHYKKNKIQGPFNGKGQTGNHP